MLFTSKGVINIDNKKWEKDFSVLDEAMEHSVGSYYSKAYVRHLFKAGEILGLQIASLQNLSFYLWLMGQAREHIVNGSYALWHKEMIVRLKARL
jgi:queuine tRNA-ribosyltransferase